MKTIHYSKEPAFVREVLSFYVVYLKVWLQATARKWSRILPFSFKSEQSPLLTNSPRVHSTFVLSRA